MSKKKIIIIIVIVAVLMSLGAGVVYKNIDTTKKLEEFGGYVEGYKTEMSNYIIEQHKDKYEDILATSEKLVDIKDVKSIEKLKEEFTEFKEEVVQDNLELMNNNIAELENVDISKLEDKESIATKMNEAKKLRDDSKFIEANELFISLKEDINKKLEAMKLEEAKKLEEEKRRLEEEEKSSDIEFNINNYILEKYEALELYYKAEAIYNKRNLSKEELVKLVEDQSDFQDEIRKLYNVTSAVAFFDKVMFNYGYEDKTFIQVGDSIGPSYFIEDEPVYMFVVQYPSVRTIVCVTESKFGGSEILYGELEKGTLYEVIDNKKVKVTNLTNNIR